MAGDVADQYGLEEVVVLFDTDLQGIERELRHEEFESLVEGRGTLEEAFAGVVHAAFAVVEVALSVRSMVFFTFKVDEQGVIDSNFNLPLRYLADSAGPGPDLGAGTIRLACRGQCPVPWHAVNLWQPVEDADRGSIALVQNAIWRNRLGLQPSGKLEEAPDDDFELTDHFGFELEPSESNPERNADPIPPLDPNPIVNSDPQPNLKRESGRPVPPSIPPVPPPISGRETQRALESRLTDAFGEEGKVNLENLIRQHNERLTEAADRYRVDLQEQQRGYLQQIKACRDEIQQLKSALRNEQERSRRLQSLLRGDP
jgi:hypothetical protein